MMFILDYIFETCFIISTLVFNLEAMEVTSYQNAKQFNHNHFESIRSLRVRDIGFKSLVRDIFGLDRNDMHTNDQLQQFLETKKIEEQGVLYHS